MIRSTPNNKTRILPKSPIILGMLLVILTACSSTTFAQGEGDKYVLGSLNRLLTINTIESDIRLEIYVDGEKHAAGGRYEEQALPRTAPGQPTPFFRSMYRLDIVFSQATSNAERNRMTLVCYPETDRERSQIERRASVEGIVSYSMIDLKKLEERLRTADGEMLFTQVSEVRNLGGLAGMMRQICRFYEFSLPTQENLQVEETIPTLKLTGQLRSIFHKNLLPRFGGLDKRGNYPADFPSDIEIWLGRIDEFPYQIRYLRRISEKSEQKELLFQESFSNVIINGTPISASKFSSLIPPEDISSAKDDTDDFIRSLGL